MQSKLKPNIHPKKFIVMLAIICALLGSSIVLLSDFMIIPFAAVYAALLWFDAKKKILSALLPVPILAFSCLGGVATIFSVAVGFCMGLIIFFMYRAKISKLDTALALTAFFSLYLFFSLFIQICLITKDYSIASAFEYYNTFMETQKASFVEAFSALAVTDQSGATNYLFTKETAELMFLSVAKLTIAFLVITAFLMCGFTLKIFSRVIIGAQENEEYIRTWRFALPNLYAYFYAVVFILSFMLGNGEDVAAIAIQNLSYVFMAMFAYIGLRHLLLVSLQVRRKGMFYLIVFMGIMLFSVTAIQILSFLGAYVTILSNRSIEPDNNQK